jgi:hypothetical protein
MSLGRGMKGGEDLSRLMLAAQELLLTAYKELTQLFFAFVTALQKISFPKQ